MTRSAYTNAKGKKRIVVTGMGVISPAGHGHHHFFQRLTEGHNCAAKATFFETKGFPSNKVCEVKGFDFERYCAPGRREEFAKVGQASKFAIAATQLAFEDGNFHEAVDSYGRHRIGVSLGTTMGEVQILHDIARSVARDGLPQSGIYREQVPHNLPTNVAKYFGLHGANSLIPTACASGNYAIGLGCDWIRRGQADAVIVGGVDPIDSIVFAGFCRLFSVAPEMCQPFDKNRKGLLVGEGAAVLILESAESAMARKAKIHAEILGYGLSCDAFHMTKPEPEVSGTYKAAMAAFNDAEISAETVDCVVAHGTGTPANDKAETKLLKRLFGERAYDIPVTANKSMIGHTMGAAAAMNAVTACHILTDGAIPPTINHHTDDPECDLDYVPNQTRKADVNVVLSNAFAFGGNNSTMLFKKW